MMRETETPYFDSSDYVGNYGGNGFMTKVGNGNLIRGFLRSC